MVRKERDWVVDEGINETTTIISQKDKDDIDDEIEAMKFTDDHEG
jgi:hypothetical protein